MRRRANSIAARINVAFASPTPSNCVRVFRLHFQSLFVNDPRQLSCQRHHVHTRRALPQQHRQQFLIAQCPRAFSEELFSRAVRLGDLVNGLAHTFRRANDKLRLDHGHGHDVEDAAGVRVFGIGQFLVTSTLVIGRLNLAVDLTSVWAFQVDAIVAMGMDGRADDGSADFFFCDLL